MNAININLFMQCLAYKLLNGATDKQDLKDITVNLRNKSKLINNAIMLFMSYNMKYKCDYGYFIIDTSKIKEDNNIKYICHLYFRWQ